MEQGQIDEDSAGESFWSLSGEEARATVREYRAQLLRYTGIPAPPDAGLSLVNSDAGATRLSKDELPPELRRLVAEYERARPGVCLVPVRYVVVDGSEGVSVPPAPDELPDAEEMVSLSVTETLLSAEQVQVRTWLLIAVRDVAEAPPK